MVENPNPKIHTRNNAPEFSKKIRSLFCVACVACLVFLSQLGEVYAYEFGVNSPYIKLSAPDVGTITLYVPQNMAEYLSLSSSGQVVSSYSGTIILYTNSNDYSYSISTYSTIRYRTTTSGSYTYISNAQILESNFLNLTSGKLNSINKDYAFICLLIVIAGGVLCSWWRR